jgi:HSP20 family protein
MGEKYMSLIRWTPMDVFNDMDEVFNRFPMMQGNQSMKSFVPAMDVYETDKEVIIETPLAGIGPEEVSVSVQKGVLTIKGESKKEHEVDEKNYYRKEIRSGSFYREVQLPTQVIESEVKAEFDNGMLKVICPKAQPAEAKKIDVQVKKK